MRGFSRRLLLFLACFLLLPSLSTASVLSGYFETGGRSQAEDFEEEDDDKEYTFRNYHLKFRHRATDRFSYDFSSFLYDKDYKSENSLDNTSAILKANGSYLLNRQKSLRLDIKLKYREKRYRNSPSGEYDQIMFSPKLVYVRKDSHKIDLSAGINNYDYTAPGGNDQLKLFSRLGAKKYLLEKKLVIVSSVKFETGAYKRAKRRKNKNDFMLGFSYKIDSPVIYKITARSGFGQRDTKDNDERDEDFDYKYSQFYVKTEHRINPKTATDIKYLYFKKDYLTADLDHSGFYIRNNWKYKVLADEIQDLYFGLACKHKETDYALKPGNDYKKDTIGIKGTYRRKKNWKASAAVEGNFYNFRDPGKDKNRYYGRLSFEKSFPAKALTLSADFRYKYTDNKQANNTEEASVRLAFKYRF